MRYPKLNPWELEPYFSQHMMSMTEENLDSKADIAEQLAWRDSRIVELEKRVKGLLSEVAKLERFIRTHHHDS